MNRAVIGPGAPGCRNLSKAPSHWSLTVKTFVWNKTDKLKAGSHGAVVSAALSERKVAGSIPTIGDFHTVGPCKKAAFASLATDVK